MPPASLLLSVFSSSHPSFSSSLRFSFFLTFFSLYSALFFLSSLRLSICFDRCWIERLLRRWRWLIERKMVTFRLNQATVYSRVDCFRITECGNWVELIRDNERFRDRSGGKVCRRLRSPIRVYLGWRTGRTDVYVQEFNLFLRRNYRAKLFVVASELSPLRGNTTG